LETGFFHADPHPGNLLVTKDGRLALIDFGLMADVPIQVIVDIQQYFSVSALMEEIYLGFFTHIVYCTYRKEKLRKLSLNKHYHNLSVFDFFPKQLLPASRKMSLSIPIFVVV
jgi:tRNA A-37 threonylcarbamoyl transferase component Bud32